MTQKLGTPLRRGPSLTVQSQSERRSSPLLVSRASFFLIQQNLPCLGPLAPAAPGLWERRPGVAGPALCSVPQAPGCSAVLPEEGDVLM